MTRADDLAALTWVQPDSPLLDLDLDQFIAWSETRPEAGVPDIPSIVMARMPADRIADRELAVLADFARRATADYDTRAPYRLGCNAIVADPRRDGRWLAARLTDASDTFAADSLPAALAPLELELPLDGRWLMFADRSVYRVGPGCWMDIRVVDGGETPAEDLCYQHVLFPEAGGEMITLDPQALARAPIAVADSRARRAELARMHFSAACAPAAA